MADALEFGALFLVGGPLVAVTFAIGLPVLLLVAIIPLVYGFLRIYFCRSQSSTTRGSDRASRARSTSPVEPSLGSSVGGSSSDRGRRDRRCLRLVSGAVLADSPELRATIGALVTESITVYGTIVLAVLYESQRQRHAGPVPPPADPVAAPPAPAGWG